MNYLRTAETIFNWLAPYQILQDYITARSNEGRLSFQLNHPVEGSIAVDEPLPPESYFRSHGIGLEMEKEGGKDVRLRVYDFGGIFDPIDSFVPGEHYATTHFALLGAILYLEKRDPSILEKVKKAIDFHLATSRHAYRFREWGYHWDFQNYAFLEVYSLIKDALSEEEKKRWEEGLIHPTENKENLLTNWIAMRAYSSALRYRLFHRLSDQLRFFWRLRLIKKARQKDGCFDDSRNRSRPIQYHVFTLALLHRILRICPNKKIEHDFLDGVRYFIPFVDPEGCFNYIGRGQEQLFGYGVALYVLEAAKSLDRQNTDLVQDAIQRIWHHLIQFKKNGHFPLVLNVKRDEERFGWYDYHHLTVYEAFLGAWLALTHRIQNEVGSSQTVHTSVPKRYVKHFQSTKVAVVSKSDYFIVFTGGTPDYISEPGITPAHLWFQGAGWVYSCPGGPSPEEFGRIRPVAHVEKNVLAPIAQDSAGRWIGPYGREAKIFKSDCDTTKMVFDYGPFKVQRVVHYGDDTKLLFEDHIQFHKTQTFQEFRFFNFPISTDKFQTILQNGTEIQFLVKEKAVLFLQLEAFMGLCLEHLEKIKTAKGMVQIVSLRMNNFSVKKGEGKILRFFVRR